MLNQTENIVFEGRARDSSSLNARLSLNQKYQSRDFHNWLQGKLAVYPGEKILDVGCGTGAQSLRFLDDIGERGTVSSLDINEESVQKLIMMSVNDKRLEAIAGDMDNLGEIVLSKFNQKKYTLAHSSYALYYSSDPVHVLRTMADLIYDSGRVAVFTPVGPHGMVEIASKFSEIPSPVIESLEFGPKTLEPEFRSLFWDVEIHFFQSEMRVDSIDDFINFYKATTYYNEDVLEGIKQYALSQIEKYGSINYDKNGYLIIGRNKKIANEY